ncbi:MAG: AbrB/MazE/SpoVT family DNA-binding domain-containing protein [Thermanaerothrix sp.]|uniref:AbrB/MazE/SpoVT family DNA-binding domain-containing protein n=1 Tax=Thermanaerothrix sp. TaxID=2972675 RepID=UPI003C7B2CB6
MKIRLSRKGWVVIPAALRKKYHLKPGDELRVVDYGGVLALIPVHPDPIPAGIGLLRGEDSLAQAIVEEHAREREHDESRLRVG